MDRWYRVMDAYPDARNHPHRSLFPSQITLAKYRKEHIMEKIASLNRLLHGRQRKRMRLAMSERIREMESLLESKKLGRLIQQLLPDYTEPLDRLQSAQRRIWTALRKSCRCLPSRLADYERVDGNSDGTQPNRSAYGRPDGRLGGPLLRGSLLPDPNLVPLDIRQEIAVAISAKTVFSTVRTDLAEAMNSPFTFSEFNTADATSLQVKALVPLV